MRQFLTDRDQNRKAFFVPVRHQSVAVQLPLCALCVSVVTFFVLFVSFVVNMNGDW